MLHVKFCCFIEVTRVGAKGREAMLNKCRLLKTTKHMVAPTVKT